MMKCPNCKKISPDEDSKCDCGYLFPTIYSSPVIVKDIEMKFFSMMWFMVKWAFAAIPAMIIIAIIVAFVMMLLGGFTTSLIDS
ncbi:MAG: hypothetical protein E3K37_02945 [Candidatus Kuenenia sp.]|nr:hypothetical protein [Candidatus Kuenenia hertensis]